MDKIRLGEPYRAFSPQAIRWPEAAGGYNRRSSRQPREINTIMSQHTPIPTGINLHRKSRVLEVKFDDGAAFRLPCEYLRVFSPSAEVKVLEQRGGVVMGREDVNIDNITPVGTYAVRLHFDDGHDSGIYTWQTLYELGRDQEPNWARYLARCADARGTKTGTVRILYFVGLVDRLERDHEEVELPESVTDVQTLLAWLRRRGSMWEQALGEATLKITVNKQFAEPHSPVGPGDEVAIVPSETL